MLRTFLRHWLLMLAFAALLATMAAPVWIAANVINRLTDNLWIGFGFLMLTGSLLCAAMMAALGTPRGQRLLHWLMRLQEGPAKP